MWMMMVTATTTAAAAAAATAAGACAAAGAGARFVFCFCVCVCFFFNSRLLGFLLAAVIACEVSCQPCFPWLHWLSSPGSCQSLPPNADYALPRHGSPHPED